jgi:hypothetical protein
MVHGTDAGRFLTVLSWIPRKSGLCATQDGGFGVLKFRVRVLLIVSVLAVLLLSASGWAKPVGKETALQVARAWLDVNPAPMVRDPAGRVWKVRGVRPFLGRSGETLAYVVDLKPQGFVVVPADDEIEPILTFGTEGNFPTEIGSEQGEILSDLLMSDIPSRIRNKDRALQEYRHKVAERWAKAVKASTEGVVTQDTTVATVTPVVGPLITALWGQGPDNAPYTYNYCIPNHYVTGCTANAMAMIVRYHRYPASASGTNTIYLAGAATVKSFNDTFNYDLMPDQLTGASPLANIIETSKLVYDCGISCKMQYNTRLMGGSGAYLQDAALGFKNHFHYAAADHRGGTDPNSLVILRDEMCAGFPTILGIYSHQTPAQSHAVVCDGWGTEDGLDRFHLNLGWNGDYNNWYSLPVFATSFITWDTLTNFVYNIRKPSDMPPDMPALLPDGGAISGPVNVSATCASPGAVIRYTTNGIDPTENDPIATGPILVDRSLTLKARAWTPRVPPSLVRSAEYTIVPLASIKSLVNNSTVSIPASVVTAVPSTGRFYVEATDRSSGIMVYKSGYAATPGKMVRVQGSVGTASTGERWVTATSIKDAGTGSVDPITLSNRDVGGGDWNYNASTGAGQKGMREYRIVKKVRTTESFAVQGLNNVGILITTFGKVTFATSPGTTPAYFYINDEWTSGERPEDEWGRTDNSGNLGVKVLGTVPQPSPLPPGWTAKDKYVQVTGISTCFKAPSPSTDLYRQIAATQVVVLQ